MKFLTKKRTRQITFSLCILLFVGIPFHTTQILWRNPMVIQFEQDENTAINLNQAILKDKKDSALKEQIELVPLFFIGFCGFVFLKNKTQNKAKKSSLNTVKILRATSFYPLGSMAPPQQI